MIVADGVCVVSGDLLPGAEQEAAACLLVLLQHPAVGAVVGVLGSAAFDPLVSQSRRGPLLGLSPG